MNTETTPAAKEDERAKFEAWATAPERQLPIERHPLGPRTYADPRTAWAWSAWTDKPLAALAGAPQEAPGDAPSDKRIKVLEAALKEARRAIGYHFAPDDCYATGPLTGDPIRDLVACPACSAIAMFDAAMKGPQ